MSATATLTALTDIGPSIAPPTPPMVLIDGQPRADLAAIEIEAVGPLDERRAVLAIERNRAAIDPFERSAVAGLRGSRVWIVQPMALVDGSSRLLPLFDGRIGDVRQHIAAAEDRLDAVATDLWSSQLRVRIEDLASVDAASTVDEVITLANLWAGVNLSTELLPASMRDAAAGVPIEAGVTVERLLRRLCDTLGLVVERNMVWGGHRVVERRYLRQIATGRPVRLGLGELANPTGAVASIKSTAGRPTPVKFVAEARGQIVESTFSLIAGWTEADQDLADDQYARSTSDDFDAVAAVFRLWVLNEDEAYGGPVFDLTGLFDEGRAIPPQPLRLIHALTRDAGGRSVGVVVETSLDAGVSWSRVAGRVVVLTDRAGVYLDDDTLADAWLAAVRAGDARVRVTASLRSPLPITTVRWVGNPFRGPFDESRIALGDAFAHRRVAPTSRYAADVAAGSRDADTADGRAAMASWLVAHAATAPPLRGKATIDVVGPTLALRIGDRIERLAGRPIGLDVTDPLVGPALVTIRGIHRRFDRAMTRVECEMR